MQNQNSGVNALIVGNSNSHVTTVTLNKDDILVVKGDENEFIPLQQILTNKVKMIFNDSPTRAGNYTIFNKKEKIENISYNYDRSESNLTLSSQNLLSNYKTVESIKSLFDKLQTDRTDNQIWKWFVIFALLFLIIEMAIIRFVK